MNITNKTSKVQSLSKHYAMSSNKLVNKRVKNLVSISSPSQVLEEFPQPEESQQMVIESRQNVENIIHQRNARLLVVIGPCSIHDPKSAIEYAEWLAKERARYSGQLEIVMRTYLEKPRTTTGWKGIIYDPHLDGSGNMDEGIRIARKLLLEITSLGLPVSTEMLDIRSPQYFSDLITWGVIGARTIESQLHRELVSGLSFPVGLKNGTAGGIQIAIDALGSSATEHSFIGIDMDGQTAIVKTKGNEDTHLILRGSKEGPNYGAEEVEKVVSMLDNANQNTSIMIDCSHANSGKDFHRQPVVCSDVAEQISAGNENIIGVMIESNLVEGNQKIGNGKDLNYGQSITDACVGLDDSSNMLAQLASSVDMRRAK